jgi:hypothetical protein
MERPPARREEQQFKRLAARFLDDPQSVRDGGSGRGRTGWRGLTEEALEYVRSSAETPAGVILGALADTPFAAYSKA